MQITKATRRGHDPKVAATSNSRPVPGRDRPGKRRERIRGGCAAAQRGELNGPESEVDLPVVEGDPGVGHKWDGEDFPCDGGLKCREKNHAHLAYGKILEGAARRLKEERERKERADRRAAGMPGRVPGVKPAKKRLTVVPCKGRYCDCVHLTKNGGAGGEVYESHGHCAHGLYPDYETDDSASDFSSDEDLAVLHRRRSLAPVFPEDSAFYHDEVKHSGVHFGQWDTDEEQETLPQQKAPLSALARRQSDQDEEDEPPKNHDYFGATGAPDTSGDVLSFGALDEPVLFPTAECSKPEDWFQDSAYLALAEHLIWNHQNPVQETESEEEHMSLMELMAEREEKYACHAELGPMKIEVVEDDPPEMSESTPFVPDLSVPLEFANLPNECLVQSSFAGLFIPEVSDGPFVTMAQLEAEEAEHRLTKKSLVRRAIEKLKFKKRRKKDAQPELKEVKNAQEVDEDDLVSELPTPEPELFSGADFFNWDIEPSMDQSERNEPVATFNEHVFFAGECAHQETQYARLLYREKKTIYLGGEAHTSKSLPFLERLVNNSLKQLGKMGIMNFTESTKTNPSGTCVTREAFDSENNNRRSYRFFFQTRGPTIETSTPKDCEFTMSKFELSATVDTYTSMYLTLKNNAALMKRKKVDGNGNALASLETAATAVLGDPNLIDEFRLWAEDPQVFSNTMVHWINQMDIEGNFILKGLRPANRLVTPPPGTGAPESASSKGSGKGK